MSSRQFSLTRSSRAVLATALLGLAWPSFAQQQPPKRELSEATHQAVASIIKKSEENKWDEIYDDVNKLLAAAGPDSFDRAFLLRMRVQASINRKDFNGAINDLETAIAISDRMGFFDEKNTADLVYTLAQLYGQEAGNEKNAAIQTEKLNKAYAYLTRWLKAPPKTASVSQLEDAQYFSATILYNQATANQSKVDMALLTKALAESEKGLYMKIRPSEKFLQMAIASLMQMGDHAKAAEYLEQVVKLNPTSKTFWQYLLNAYLSQETPETLVRAILTIERAQKVGVMTSEQDNFNLAGLYANAQQYDYCAQLLEKGLADGTIKPEQKNWELLAQSYQQVRKEQKAIDAYKRAAKLYPNAGSIDQQIGNLYYQLDKYEEAFKYLNSAVSKKVDKPATVYTFIAYLGLELKKLDEAKQAVTKALEAKPDSKEAKRLEEAIDEAIAQRRQQTATNNKS